MCEYTRLEVLKCELLRWLLLSLAAVAVRCICILEGWNEPCAFPLSQMPGKLSLWKCELNSSLWDFNSSS